MSPTWDNLSCFLGGVLVVSVAQLIWSIKKRHVLTLPQRMLFDEADTLHTYYRRLDQHHRDDVKLPLHNSSWPAFDKEWSYAHAMLFALQARVTQLGRFGHSVFKTMRWETESVELFHVGESVLMADLLHALDEFRNLMRSKY